MPKNTPDPESETAIRLDRELQERWLIGQDKRLLVSVSADHDRLNAMHANFLEWLKTSRRGQREIGESIIYARTFVLRALLSPLLAVRGCNYLRSDSLREFANMQSVRYEFGRDGLMRFEGSTGGTVQLLPYGTPPSEIDDGFRFQIGRFVSRPKLQSLGLGHSVVASSKDIPSASWRISFSQMNRPTSQIGAGEPSIQIPWAHLVPLWYATRIEAVFDTDIKCLVQYDVYDDEGHAVLQCLFE